jgi:DNA-damage-inducible protein J
MFVKMTLREDRLPFDVKGHSFEPLGKTIQPKGVD